MWLRCPIMFHFYNAGGLSNWNSYALICRSEWDFENRINDGEPDVALPGSPEVLADQFGVRTALLVLCIALFIAAIYQQAEFREM